MTKKKWAPIRPRKPKLEEVATKQQMELLGRITDREFADMIGFWPESVRRARMRLGIPPLHIDRTPGNRNTVNIRQMKPMMGNFYDRVVADVVGCSEEWVRHNRVRMGIKSLRSKEQRDSRAVV